MKQQIEIFRDRKKSRSLFIKSAAICILLAVAAVYSFGVFDGVIKLKLAIGSVVFLVIMLWLLFSSLAKLKNTGALVTMHSKGISGTTTPLSKSFGEIEWVDVQDIQLQKVGGDTLVAFAIQNDSKYDGRLSRAYRNMAFKKDSNQYVIMYTASEIETDAESLYALVISYWKANQTT